MLESTSREFFFRSFLQFSELFIIFSYQLLIGLLLLLLRLHLKLAHDFHSLSQPPEVFINAKPVILSPFAQNTLWLHFLLLDNDFLGTTIVLFLGLNIIAIQHLKGIAPVLRET